MKTYTYGKYVTATYLATCIQFDFFFYLFFLFFFFFITIWPFYLYWERQQSSFAIEHLQFSELLFLENVHIPTP